MRGVNRIVLKNNNKIRTSTLLRRLFKTSDLDGFMVKHENEMNEPLFHEYLKELCYVMNQIPERVIKHAAIERTYGHQLFNGTRKPSRDKVIQLALGFGLDVEEVQNLLRIAQKSPLYPRIKRDAAILYCINHNATIEEVQGLLYDLGLTLLGGNL